MTRSFSYRPANSGSAGHRIGSEFIAANPPVPNDVGAKLKKGLEKRSLFQLRREFVDAFKWIHGVNKVEAEFLIVELQKISRGY